MGMARANFHLTELANQITRITMNKQIELELYKTTKRTFVYKTEDMDSLITSVYLQKSQMPAEMIPRKITITVDFD